MNNRLTVFLIISLVVGAICYMSLENIIIALVIFAIYLLTSIVFLEPRLKKYEYLKTRYHECYHFINNFIITLSIKKSIAGALETTVGSMNSEFVDLYRGLENMTDNEKLEYLYSYFDFYDYSLFLQIINIWQEEGGDIISMSKYLIGNVRHNEEYISRSDMISKRKYVEVGVLWTISLAIIVILRFALNDFYSRVKGQMIFIISLSMVFLFALLTIYLLVQKGTSLNLKGNASHEKAA